MSTLIPILKLIIAFTAGAITVLAFAPFDLFYLAVLGPAILLWLLLSADPRTAFGLGWFFGLGLFGVGVFWLHISIDQFGGVGHVFAILITLAFTAGLALFYGLLGWLGRRIHGAADWYIQLAVYVSLWVLLEWLRGWILTGFPWLSLGYSQIGTPLQGYAPLFGVYGVTLVTVISSACLVALVKGLRASILALLVVALLWGAGWMLTQKEWSMSSGDAIKVSIIQANVVQGLKWKPETRQPTINIYRYLTNQEWGSDLIVWPETAIPDYFNRLENDLWRGLEKEAQKNGSDLLVGIAVWDDNGVRYFNSVSSLGSVRNAYFKRHLVPFGEFMPMRWLLKPLIEFLRIPMSNFSAGDADQPLVQVLGRKAGVSICYEDAFGAEVIQAMPEAEFLVNVSNDAWFGDSIALPQHLQIARMRSLETGRYQLRATNTGISALIDPQGKLIATSPINKEHVLRGEIVPMTGTTIYAMVGNWGIVVLCSLLLAVALVVRYRSIPTL